MITKIYNNIFVGIVDDVKCAKQDGYSVLGCCKEPLHRKNARIQGAPYDGYVTKAMPSDEPEYLFAEREHALYCNLIDAPKIEYIPDAIINKCMEFIDGELSQGRKVVIICNKAESRSPSIAFMWLIEHGKIVADSYDEAKAIFTYTFYRQYKPGKGFDEYVEKFWEDYKERKWN